MTHVGTAAPGCPASEARWVFLPASRTEIEQEFYTSSKFHRLTNPNRLMQAELRSVDSRGRLSPHNTSMPQAFYRRQLPHLQCDDKQHFVTFCTDHRWVLPKRVRSIVLKCCLYHNGQRFD